MNAGDISRLARRAIALGPRVTAQKAVAAARSRLVARAERRADAARPTYRTQGPPRLERLFALPETLPGTPEFFSACRLYMAHTFDVLGSGWVEVAHGMRAAGVEGRRYEMGASVIPDPGGEWLRGRVTSPNLAEARRRWALVSADYRPIDWHVDVKSGYRWAETTWFKDATYGQAPGADVKVPWELSRAHHLPQLALRAATLEPRERDRVGREVCNQIMDFSAANPPRFGCNWFVTMDVGIRVANWCVAVDLLRAAGFELEPDVEAAIALSVTEHAAFIARNLEWFEHLRSNHYLGNLAGLAFAAAYLPSTRETDSWLSFAAAALVLEAQRQYEPDGGNFEGSTAYHRLSTELLLWGLAVLRAVPSERARRIGPFDAGDFTAADPPPAVTAESLRAPELEGVLVRAAYFALDCTRPDGRIVQFGDCDSGRLFKFSPVLRYLCAEELAGVLENLEGWTPPRSHDGEALPLEEHLDVRHLMAATGELSGSSELVKSAADPLEASVMAALGRAHGVAAEVAPDAGPGRADGGDGATESLQPAARGNLALSVRVGDEARLAGWARDVADGGDGDRNGSVRSFSAPEGLLAGLELAGYPDFGLWVWRSERLWLAVRCGSVGQYGAAGHVHNDQLAMELWIDGRPLVVDPGTYLYTPLPERRNEYRSVGAHDAPRLDSREPGQLTHGLFQIEGAVPGVCDYFGPRGFVGWHDGYGPRVTRLIELLNDAVVVRDLSEGGAPVDVAAAAAPYSPGYGMRLRAGEGVMERFLGIESGRS